MDKSKLVIAGVVSVIGFFVSLWVGAWLLHYDSNVWMLLLIMMTDMGLFLSAVLCFGMASEKK